MAKTKSKNKDKKTEDKDEALENIRWEAFCHFYLFGGQYESSEVSKRSKKKKKKTKYFRMGNGTLSYCMAFQLNPDDISNYNTARTECVRILANPSIKKRMRDILEREGFNDNVVDSRLMDIIINGRNQDSNVAIKEYNNLQKRISSGLTPVLVPLDDEKRLGMNKALEYLMSKKK